jgi:hypothetical protein
MAMNMKVDEPVRTITLELDSTTAKEMADWIADAGVALGSGKIGNNHAPHEINELYGALVSIAQNRGYGGH